MMSQPTGGGRRVKQQKATKTPLLKTMEITTPWTALKRVRRPKGWFLRLGGSEWRRPILVVDDGQTILVAGRTGTHAASCGAPLDVGSLKEILDSGEERLGGAVLPPPAAGKANEGTS